MPLSSIPQVMVSVGDVENPPKDIQKKESFEDTLIVLSKEFDSLGLPPLDITKPSTVIFQQVVRNARLLVQIHRKTVSKVKDVNIDSRSKETKCLDLYKKIDDYKLSISKLEDKSSQLQNKLSKLNDDKVEMMKKEYTLKEEMAHIKRYYVTKQNELQHSIKKLTKENQHLRDVFGKGIDVPNSKDEVVIKLLKKHKMNEVIYKTTIQKLQENNKELLEEALNLKEELAIALLNKSDIK